MRRLIKALDIKMFYRLYCSSGNLLGIDEYVCYSEIDDDGFWQRYVEIRAGGTALRYSRAHSADNFGVLPEGSWHEHQITGSEFGTVVDISGVLFEAVWSVTQCRNEA